MSKIWMGGSLYFSMTGYIDGGKLPLACVDSILWSHMEINYNNVDLSFVYLARLEVSIINYIVKSVEADITMMKKSMTKCYTPRLNRNTQVRDIWRDLPRA